MNTCPVVFGQRTPTATAEPERSGVGRFGFRLPHLGRLSELSRRSPRDNHLDKSIPPIQTTEPNHLPNRHFVPTMASRRAAVSIAQLAAPSSRAAIPTRIRATTQLSLRQYHNRAQQLQPLVAGIRQSRTPCARQCATAKARGYSTKAETKAKILDFEAVRRLQPPSPLLS